ncbi:TatD family hydrolase [Actinomycetaceae bacterium MB13-C1-2]|nr:TatD family hydrolase [Actinomycetaceae bacterium MB13-C1-2]
MGKKSREWPPLGEVLPAEVMDNHTHLPVHEGEIPNAQGFKMPLEQQLNSAEQVGVSRLITVGCSLPDIDPTLALAREWPQVKAAIAIHPNEAALHAGFTQKSPDGFEHELEDRHIPLVAALERVSESLGDPEVVAVGETGLDYFRTGPEGREAQRESFEIHLEMAREHGLPLQIHDREAHADTLAVLHGAAWSGQQIVFHCFSGDEAMAKELAKNDWYASFGGSLTYPANSELREALRTMPRELVLVETDAPYLTPVPYRGCPNASYVMPYTVRAIAELWDESVEQTCHILMRNSRNVYGTW